MRNLSKTIFTTVCLLAIGLFIQSCTEQGIQLEKEKVQFTLTPFSTSDATTSVVELPENARAWISVASSNGTSVLVDHEVAVHKTDAGYVTDAVELAPGTYTITDFIIVEDSIGLYVTPKKGAELCASEADALPFNLTIAESHTANVNMRIVSVRDQDLEKFGYSSSKAKGNSFSIQVFDNNIPTNATAELRQDKKLLKTFSLGANVNTITVGGNHKATYTLTVYTSKSAKIKTFNLKDLKKEIGKKPLQISLEPALVFTTESYVDEANEYEEYFEFRMDGAGSVNINWGDGEQSAETLPLQISHEYFTGNYTAFVTGDIDQVTDFAGFSYSTIITTITGLTNLTSLKTYNPSWGAVPIKVDLSNCTQLETINIAKYGAPYEPCDLRTEFKLPTEHYITTFIFDATSFDSNREFISSEELDVMFNKVYNNAIARNLHNGKFYVNPVETPSAETQQKLDQLENDYNWRTGFNDEIYEAWEDGRSKRTSDAHASREQWLKERFENSSTIIQRGSVNVNASLN